MCQYWFIFQESKRRAPRKAADADFKSEWNLFIFSLQFSILDFSVIKIVPMINFKIDRKYFTNKNRFYFINLLNLVILSGSLTFSVKKRCMFKLFYSNPFVNRHLFCWTSLWRLLHLLYFLIYLSLNKGKLFRSHRLRQNCPTFESGKQIDLFSLAELPTCGVGVGGGGAAGG